MGACASREERARPEFLSENEKEEFIEEYKRRFLRHRDMKKLFVGVQSKAYEQNEEIAIKRQKSEVIELSMEQEEVAPPEIREEVTERVVEEASPVIVENPILFKEKPPKVKKEKRPKTREIIPDAVVAEQEVRLTPRRLRSPEPLMAARSPSSNNSPARLGGGARYLRNQPPPNPVTLSRNSSTLQNERLSPDAERRLTAKQMAEDIRMQIPRNVDFFEFKSGNDSPYRMSGYGLGSSMEGMGQINGLGGTQKSLELTNKNIYANSAFNPNDDDDDSRDLNANKMAAYDSDEEEKNLYGEDNKNSDDEEGSKDGDEIDDFKTPIVSTKLISSDLSQSGRVPFGSFFDRKGMKGKNDRSSHSSSDSSSSKSSKKQTGKSKFSANEINNKKFGKQFESQRNFNKRRSSESSEEERRDDSDDGLAEKLKQRVKRENSDLKKLISRD